MRCQQRSTEFYRRREAVSQSFTTYPQKFTLTRGRAIDVPSLPFLVFFLQLIAERVIALWSYFNSWMGALSGEGYEIAQHIHLSKS